MSQKKAKERRRLQSAQRNNALLKNSPNLIVPRRNVPFFGMAQQLLEILNLVGNKDFELAKEKVDRLCRTYPNRPECITLQLTIAAFRLDIAQMVESLERLVQLQPNDADSHYQLAELYLVNSWFLMAMKCMSGFLARWPDHPKANRARVDLAKIEEMIPEIVERSEIQGENRLEHAHLHEQMLAYLNLGRYADARRIGEQLVQLQPDFIPALNNLAGSCIALGDYSSAMLWTERALSLDSENAFAVANLVVAHVFAGRMAEAQTHSEKLKELKPSKVDSQIKVVEALSYLGDDEGVLAAAERARNLGSTMPPSISALVEHFTATALCRLGREGEARWHWQRALNHDSSMELAQHNLEDLDRPVSERNGAWAFTPDDWQPLSLIEKYRQRLKGCASANEETAAARQFLLEHPGLPERIQILLDRGDPDSREFALRIALSAKTPTILETLTQFALGQRGTDSMRLRAGKVVAEAGLLPAGSVRMWMEGKWREVLLLEFKITKNRTGEMLSQRAEELYRRAYDLINARDGVAAESILREAMAVEPTSPRLHQGLINALRLQHRDEEAEAMTRETHSRFPDYFFGILGMAELAIDAGQLDEAKKLLDELTTRKLYHISEFCGLASRHVKYFLACGMPEAAEHWLRLFEQTHPEDSNLPVLKELVERSKWSCLPLAGGV